MLRCLLVIAVVALTCCSGSAATYYLDGSRGSDANSGTSANLAWRTLDKANSALQPGDTCLVRAGVYTGQVIAPANSGTEKAPITYAPYQGETPELTGGRDGSLVILDGKSYITVKGFKIYSPEGHDWVVRVTGDNAHHNRIEACDISDPEGYAPVVIALGAHHNTIIGNTIHDTGHGEEGSGDCIVVNGNCHHNLITKNRCYNACHSQIMLMNGSQHNTVLDNDLYATKREWSGAGIDLILGADDTQVNGNRIHDLGYITDQKCAIQVDSVHNTIRSNVIYNCGAFGISPQSYSYGGTPQPACDNLIANNTVYHCGRQGIVINSKSNLYSRSNRIVNNIVVGSPSDWYGANAWIMVFDTYHLDKPAQPGEWFDNVFQNNLFFHQQPGESNLVLYNHRGNPVTWSLAELQKQFPKTFLGNIEADPQFVNPAQGDFHLKPTSPAIGAALRLEFPFEGEVRDVGALQHSP